jgi:hypothetical protein
VFGGVFLIVLPLDRMFWPHRPWWNGVWGAGGAMVGYLIVRYMAYRTAKKAPCRRFDKSPVPQSA